MSNVLVNENVLHDIADYIREKKGESNTYFPDEFRSKLDSIPSGGGDIDKFVDGTITEVLSDNATKVKAYAFYSYTELKTIKFPKATDIGNRAFYFCTKLEKIDIPAAWSLSQYCFYNCSALVNIDIYTTMIDEYAFQNCTKLKSVIDHTGKNYGAYVFYGCKSLEFLDCGKTTKVGNQAFRNCSNLQHLVFRAGGQVCTYQNTNASYDPTNANLKIYVPRQMLEAYQTATNWVRLADKFVALEDYTVDGTINGKIRGLEY